MNEDSDVPEEVCVFPLVISHSSSSVVQISDTELIAASQVSQTTVIDTGGNECARSLKSMFKSSNDKPRRNVQFADNENLALVSYQEPNIHSYWLEVKVCEAADIIENYTKACNKGHTVVQDSIVNQLREIRNNVDYSASLNLTGLHVDADIIDTLESIFCMVTFRTIYLDKSVSPYATDVLDLLEFYDPAKELVFTDIDRDDNNMWYSVASVIANTAVLCSAAFREMVFADNSLRILFEQGINHCSTIKKIRFDACGLSRAPTFMLAHHLKNNDYIRELHLCYLDLYSKEAEILGRFLSQNSSLKILNISNNKLGDHGFELLSHGLFDQAEKDIGVEVLILFNNKLTKRSVDTIDTIISSCPLIHTINVGMNNLTDIVIYETRKSIENSLTLRAFGLQSTLITCHGITNLALACIKNVSLRHLNLRDNKAIQPESLSDLADVIHNTTLVQIDLDEKNRNCCDPQKYTELVNKVRQMTAVNKAKLEREHPSENQKWFQEPYLSCESSYVPKSLVRTTRSSYCHRFSVVPVSENINPTPRTSTTHRFTVVPANAGSGEVCEQGPSGVALKKSTNENAAGVAEISVIQEKNESVEKESCMETKCSETVIVVCDEPHNTESSPLEWVLNECMQRNAKKAASIEIAFDEDRRPVVSGAVTPISEGHPVHMISENPTTVNDELDTLGHICSQEKEKETREKENENGEKEMEISNNDSSIEIID